MDNEQYLIQRKKLKYLLSYNLADSASDNSAQGDAIFGDLWHQMEPLLSSEQSFDAGMLLSSCNTVLLYDEMRKANLIEDPCDRLDYSLESLKYISQIIRQIKDNLIDTESGAFFTRSSQLYITVISVCELLNGSPIHPEADTITTENVITSLMLYLGSYLGECAIEALGKGCWKKPQHGLFSATSFTCKNGYEYQADHIGTIFNAFYDKFVTTDIEKLIDHVQSNDIVLKTAMHIAMVQKFDLNDSNDFNQG